MYINEIFYSLQGEGLNSGRAAIFIRLSKCNLSCSFCDTEFESGEKMSLKEIEQKIKDYPSKLIIWTGGEPTLQLKEDTISYFKGLGYEQAIETNGTRPVPKGLDYITCSPKKEAIKLLNKNFPNGVSEFRFPITEYDAMPPDISLLPKAKAYLLSPVFLGEQLNVLHQPSLKRCIDYILKNPEWKLSLQLHKLIDIE